MKIKIDVIHNGFIKFNLIMINIKYLLIIYLKIILN